MYFDDLRNIWPLHRPRPLGRGQLKLPAENNQTSRGSPTPEKGAETARKTFLCPNQVCFFCLFHQLKKEALASQSHTRKCEVFYRFKHPF